MLKRSWAPMAAVGIIGAGLMLSAGTAAAQSAYDGDWIGQFRLSDDIYNRDGCGNGFEQRKTVVAKIANGKFSAETNQLEGNYKFKGPVSSAGKISFWSNFALMGIRYRVTFDATIQLTGQFGDRYFEGWFRADTKTNYTDDHACEGEFIMVRAGSPASSMLASASTAEIKAAALTAPVTTAQAPREADRARRQDEQLRAAVVARRLKREQEQERRAADRRETEARRAEEERIAAAARPPVPPVVIPVAPSAAPPAIPAASHQKNGLQADLARLKDLQSTGLITQPQYEARQQALLDRAFGAKAPPRPAGAQVQPAAGSPGSGPNEFPVPSGVNFGTYHALIIGIDNYTSLTPLGTARADARAIGKLLEEKYQFKVTMLLNPKREQILDKLDEFRATLKFTDNLLIYYAGHGWLDQKSDQGYWLPVDAKPNRRSNWISNDTITDTLKAMEAKHVMVVADSCYSGRLTRGVNIALGSPKYFQDMSRRRARVVITSGGLEPVADNNGTGHSPFTDALLKSLAENGGILDGNTLFNQIRRPVMLNADQTPQYSDVRKAGHDGGDFMFVRRR